MTAGEVSGDAQQLREEIERTRDDLGTTVEQLVARADVKGRAQARAAELARALTWQARSVMAQAPKLAAQAAGAARERRVPLSAAGAAGLLTAVAFIVWQRRKR